MWSSYPGLQERKRKKKRPKIGVRKTKFRRQQLHKNPHLDNLKKNDVFSQTLPSLPENSFSGIPENAFFGELRKIGPKIVFSYNNTFRKIFSTSFSRYFRAIFLWFSPKSVRRKTQKNSPKTLLENAFFRLFFYFTTFSASVF